MKLQAYLSLALTLTTQLLAASNSPCPSGCDCHEEKLQPYGDVLTVNCIGLGLTEIPDLSVLLGTSLGKNLRLDENELTTVTKDAFPPGLDITVLNLGQNKGLNISDNAFLNLGSSLKELKLEHIDLPFSGTLKMMNPLFSLKELSLSYNNKHPYVKGAVQNIDIPLLQGQVTKSLKVLKLSFCGIRSLSATSLGQLEKLKEIELSNNWFTSVPAVLKHIPTLTFVELFYCNIESIKDYDFSTLTRLKALDLSSNKKLNEIGPRAFAGCEQSLEKLNLARCNLTEVPTAALKKFKKLFHLDISENNYNSIRAGAFEGDYVLKKLLIGAPDMQFDPDMFQGQEANIVELDIVRMGLKSIPLKPVKTLTKLKGFSLDHNEISVLPENAFEGITANILYLGNNPISEIDRQAFYGLPPHLVINLRNTEMDDIDFMLGYPDSAIETVDLGQSKLVCRCSMKSSLNATLNIRIYGSCKKGTVTVPISSTRLEGILDQACEEERAAGSAGTRIGPLDSDSQLIAVLGISLVAVGFSHMEWFRNILWPTFTVN